MSDARAPIVVVGSGLAGWTAVREIRKRLPAAPITVVTEDDGHFYAKPALSNALAQGRDAAQLVTTDAKAMADKLSVTLASGRSAQSIESAAHVLETSNGPMRYAALILATGARALQLPLSGSAAEQVLSVNSLSDYARFRSRLAALPAGAAVAIMGAGLIGCEFANDLTLGGFKVHLVDPCETPIANLLPPEVGSLLSRALASVGVRLHLGCKVLSANAGPAGDCTLALSDGTILTCELLLSAVGLRPNLALAKTSLLACDRGVLVDRRLRTSAADIYAIGDCAQYADGGWMPYVMPIVAAGRVLAANLAGDAIELHMPLMPVVIKTPAWPVAVLPPAPGALGHWQAEEPNAWVWTNASGKVGGFVLAGPRVSERARFIARCTDSTASAHC
jgi:rubredoxin-NAD+ reductase